MIIENNIINELEVDYHWEEQGIGDCEYWGNKQIHSSLVLVLDSVEICGRNMLPYLSDNDIMAIKKQVEEQEGEY
jgi:hypothetical protein